MTSEEPKEDDSPTTLPPEYPYTGTAATCFLFATLTMGADSAMLMAKRRPVLTRQVFLTTRLFIAVSACGTIFLLLLRASKVERSFLGDLRIGTHLAFIVFIALLCSIQSGVVYPGLFEGAPKERAQAWLSHTSPTTLLTGGFFYMALEAYLRGRMGYEAFEAKDADKLLADRSQAHVDYEKQKDEIEDCLAKDKRRDARNKRVELREMQAKFKERLRYNFGFDRLYNLRHPHQNGPPLP